jgi:hypothetical protein
METETSYKQPPLAHTSQSWFKVILVYNDLESIATCPDRKL